MIFASHVFLFWFLPLVLALYAITPARGRSLLLLVASYFFYTWARADFALLLLVSTLLDYGCGRLLGRLQAKEAEGQRNRGAQRTVLILSLVGNLGLLAAFKYLAFATESLNAILGLAQVDLSLPVLRVALPVGISFYTFQSMSYTIDLYRRTVEPVRNLVDFACYVSLFPQLVCGPIVRYRDISGQLRVRDHRLPDLGRGALLVQLGFAKKILLADPMGKWAEAAFSLTDPTSGEAWLGTLAYTFQIYFDFSGYSDMAIGLGALFGFRFPVNFLSPYRAASITEFWRRWHVTLSSWLRDYLYIPLGGNRSGPTRTGVNLVITFLLCGLWHGANWTFVAWGLYHGALLILERVSGTRQRAAPGLRSLPRWALTFVLVMIGWVFFRADSVGRAGAFLAAMFGGGAGGWALPAFETSSLGFTVLGACAAVAFLAPNSDALTRKPAVWLHLFGAAVFAVALGHFFFESFRPFLYFRF